MVGRRAGGGPERFPVSGGGRSGLVAEAASRAAFVASHVIRSAPHDGTAPPEPGHIVRVRPGSTSSRRSSRRPARATRRSSASPASTTTPRAQPLEVLWEQELDAADRRRARPGRSSPRRGFDPPRLFAAYLHTLRWNCVTATDPQLFQAPFRAGIRLDAYQLEPLRKALRLPRVNLFIADDVGLGKTIEAGLIARELLLRQKVRRHRRRLPAVGAAAVAGRAGAALRPHLRDPRPRLRRAACAGSAASASTRGRRTARFLVSHRAAASTRPTRRRCATGSATSGPARC